jgi:phage terminase large subunit-like protein
VDSTVYALAWIGENPRWHGNVVKRSWLHYYTELPNDQKPKRIYMACDTTVKDEGQSDWTVCTVWQLFNRVHYLLHVERGIYEYSEVRSTIGRLLKQYNPYQIWLEETATGKALKEDREGQSRSRIKLVPIDQDRIGRLRIQDAKFREGRVLFPEGASFMSQVELELLSYPHGDTDDIVDSISLALKYGGTGYDTTMSWV